MNLQEMMLRRRKGPVSKPDGKSAVFEMTRCLFLSGTINLAAVLARGIAHI